MASVGSGYDLTSSQFSPEGRVVQLDYAEKAVAKSGTVIGVRGKDSVVLAVESVMTCKLYEEDAGRRIFSIDAGIGMAVTGLLADGIFLVDIARQEAANFREQFGHGIALKHLCDRVAGYVHAYTLYSAVRPFGLSILMSAWDEFEGPVLYKIEPSGDYCGYYACASGKGKQQANTAVEQLDFEMEVEELVKKAGEVIYKVHDQVKDKFFRLELGVVGKATNGLHRINPDKYYKIAVDGGEAAALEDDNTDDDL